MRHPRTNTWLEKYPKRRKNCAARSRVAQSVCRSHSAVRNLINIRFLLIRPINRGWPGLRSVDNRKDAESLDCETLRYPALRLARSFRTNAEFWLNLQNFFDLEVERSSAAAAEIERRVHPAGSIVS